ncbi:MAG: hypothetical protein HY766_02415 [candidate division NC10 bacterium]|nr:hypothetical protein [candidate division NC10 bacterium]
MHDGLNLVHAGDGPPRGMVPFGVAVFDNAQVRHAFSTGVFKLKFE